MRSAIIVAAVLAMVVLVSSPALASQTYTYDALGRMVMVVYDSGLTIYYTYDAAGNRTSKVATGIKVVVLPLGGFYIIPIN